VCVCVCVCVRVCVRACVCVEMDDRVPLNLVWPFKALDGTDKQGLSPHTGKLFSLLNVSDNSYIHTIKVKSIFSHNTLPYVIL